MAAVTPVPASPETMAVAARPADSAPVPALSAQSAAAPAASVADTNPPKSTQQVAARTAADSIRPVPPAPVVHLSGAAPAADEFVDSLRAMATDTSVQTVSQVAPEEVRNEAATLFGRPAASDAAATYDIEVERYASRDRVQFWLDYFSTRAANHFSVYLTRAGRYDSMIRTRLAAAGLPQDLIFLAMIESGFNQGARSRAGAVGMWQFMPSTAKRYGLTIDSWVDERRDPYYETDAAIRMLSELNDRFGSLYLAAAAYNSGPGRIQAGLARYDFGALNGDDVYFALSDQRHALRPETRDYVPKLIAAALISKDPGHWGFSTGDEWKPLRYDSLPVHYSVGLDVVARVAGTGRDVIEEMNPMYIRGVTPPDRESWVRVPPGLKDSVAARLDALPATQRITVMVHYVVRGENLGRIARQYGISTTDLKIANRLRTNYLRVGQRLIVPTALLHSRAASAASGSRASSRGRAAASRPAPSGARRVHIVRSGENLWSISQHFGVPVERLLAANNLSRRATLKVGQPVRIP